MIIKASFEFETNYFQRMETEITSLLDRFRTKTLGV